MADEIKRMPISEFRSLGFIQEINRRLLHPCGLALEVLVDGEGNETLGGIWDYREDSEGIYYSEGTIDLDKYLSVETLLNSKSEERTRLFGNLLQPPVRLGK